MVDIYDKPQAVRSAGEDICVVGGGASGSLFAIYFNRQVREQGVLDRPVRLHWIDPNGANNGGVAYGQCHEADLLNEVAIQMSPWDVGAYSAFVKERYGFDDDRGFYSRKSYQEFLLEESNRALRELQELGVEIIEHKCLATQIHAHGEDHVSLYLSDGQSLSVSKNQTVIATGYGSNDRFSALKGQAGYLHSLYDLDDFEVFHDRLREAQTSQKIAIIGSGPAVFDFVNRVHEDCLHHTLDIVSASGCLPVVRDVSVEDRNYGDPDFCHGGNFTKNTTYDQWADFVYQEFLRADRLNIPERQVAIWVLCATSKYICDREIFLSDHYKDILHRATPVPEQSHLNLWRFEDLKLYGGRVEEDTIRVLDDGRFSIEDLDTYDAVVNCTGFERHGAFVETLVDSGLARYCSDRFKVVDSDVHLIGPMVHNGCDGIESFAPQADDIARSIIKTIQNNVL